MALNFPYSDDLYGRWNGHLFHIEGENSVFGLGGGYNRLEIDNNEVFEWEHGKMRNGGEWHGTINHNGQRVPVSYAFHPSGFNDYDRHDLYVNGEMVHMEDSEFWDG